MSNDFETRMKTFFNNSSASFSKAYHNLKSWTTQKLMTFSKWMYNKLAQSQLRELDRLENQEIQNLKDYIAELESRPTPHQLARRTQISLDRKQKEQDKRQEYIDISEQRLGLSFQQLSNEEQRVINALKENALEIEKSKIQANSILSGLSSMKRGIGQDQRDLSLNRKDFDIHKKYKNFSDVAFEKELKLYAESLKVLNSKIQNAYNLQNERLMLHKKQNIADIKEQKNTLTEMHLRNKDTLGQLQLIGKSNRLDQREIGLDKKGIEQKITLIKMLEKNLSGSYNLPAIEAYNEHGYKLSNPISDRVRYLESRIEDLETDS